MCVLSCSVVSDTLRPHGLQPARLLCPWDSTGKNTAVGCHFLLQGIFPTQGLNPSLPHCGLILYWLSHQGRPSERHHASFPWGRHASFRLGTVWRRLVSVPWATSWGLGLGPSAKSPVRPSWSELDGYSESRPSRAVCSALGNAPFWELSSLVGGVWRSESAGLCRGGKELQASQPFTLNWRLSSGRPSGPDPSLSSCGTCQCHSSGSPWMGPGGAVTLKALPHSLATASGPPPPCRRLPCVQPEMHPCLSSLTLVLYVHRCLHFWKVSPARLG